MVDVRDTFWSMVRNPELLLNYLKELNVDVEDLCQGMINTGLKCPPNDNDDFRTRFLVTSYLYLSTLNVELSALENAQGIKISGLRELINDILTDMRIYNAPPTLVHTIARISRELLSKYSRWNLT